MNPRRISALTLRIIRQFRRDPRTLALLFVVPVVILSLLGYIYRGSDDVTLLGLTGDANTAEAQNLISLIEQEQRIETTAIEAETAEDAIERASLDGVLQLPGAEDTNSEGTLFTLLLEGSDPARSARLIDTMHRALPAFALLEVTDLERNPFEVRPQFIHGGPEFDQLDFLAPVFMGFFAFFFVFLLTSVSFLRERMQGSIERLLVSPISRPEIVTGYMLGFTIFAAVQSAVIIVVSIFVLDIHHVGNIGYVFLVTLLLTLGAVNLGIFLSTFARTELQVVQFIPVVIVPQALLSGMLWPVDSMPEPLRWLANAMPLYWANEALRDVMIRGADLSTIWLQITILAGFAAVLVVLGSLTLRRDVA